MTHQLSSSAQADDPVSADVSEESSTVVFTGCPAFAGHDESESSSVGIGTSRLLARFRQALLRQAVGALVEIVAGVAAHPVPAHVVLLEGRVEPLPQIDVLDRLAVGGAPAVALPLLDPAGDAAAQILAVGVEVDAAGPLERLERGDRRHQLHPIVGRMRVAALDLLLVVVPGEDRAPPARPRIARAP